MTVTPSAGTSINCFVTLDEEMMVLTWIGVEIGLGAVNRELAQQARFSELVERIVDGGKRHRNTGARRFLEEDLCRDMAVALAEQQPAQRYPLARRTQADTPQLVTQIRQWTSRARTGARLGLSACSSKPSDP